MFGLTFARRVEDEHWWDADPTIRARNLRFEEQLEQTLFAKEPPQRKDDRDVAPWLKYAVQFGLPAMLGTAVVAWVLHDATGSLKVMIELQRQTLESGRTMQMEHTIIRERLDRAERSQGVMIDILRAACWNDAKTQADRDRCRDAGASR